jgi:hypothetical protein
MIDEKAQDMERLLINGLIKYFEKTIDQSRENNETAVLEAVNYYFMVKGK